MFLLNAEKNSLKVLKWETLTSGSVNVCQVRFDFSPAWDGLEKTAVFKSDGLTYSVLLDGAGQCTIPWETLARYHPGLKLKAGVYGTKDGTVVLPTVWADLGAIQEGVLPGEASRPHTPGPYEQVLQELAGIREKLEDVPGIATDAETNEMLDGVFGPAGK